MLDASPRPTRRARLLLTLLMLATSTACTPRGGETSEAPSASGDLNDLGSAPLSFEMGGWARPEHGAISESVPVLEWDRVEITHADLVNYFRATPLLIPDAEQRPQPNADELHGMARVLLLDRLALREVQDLSPPSAQERRDVLDLFPYLEELSRLPSRERATQLTQRGAPSWSFFEFFVDARVARNRLLEQRRRTFEDEEVRAYWRRSNTTLELEVIHLANQPNAAEVEALLQADDPRIEERYERTRHRRMRPTELRAHVASVPLNSVSSRDEAEQLLQTWTNQLSNTDLELYTGPEEQVGPMEIELHVARSIQLFPALLEVRAGELSDTFEADGRLYRFAVLEEMGIERLPFDETMRRQIARELVSRRRISQATLERAESIAEMWRGAPDAWSAYLEENAHHIYAPLPFQWSEDGFVPGFAEDAALLARLFDQGEAGDVFTAESLDENLVGIIHIEGIIRPDPSGFDAMAERTRSDMARSMASWDFAPQHEDTVDSWRSPMRNFEHSLGHLDDFTSVERQ